MTKALAKALSAALSQALAILVTSQATGLDILSPRTWLLIAATSLLIGAQTYLEELNPKNGRTTSDPT